MLQIFFMLFLESSWQQLDKCCLRQTEQICSGPCWLDENKTSGMLWTHLPESNGGKNMMCQIMKCRETFLCFCWVSRNKLFWVILKEIISKTWDPELKASLRKWVYDCIGSERTPYKFPNSRGMCLQFKGKWDDSVYKSHQPQHLWWNVFLFKEVRVRTQNSFYIVFQ